DDLSNGKMGTAPSHVRSCIECECAGELSMRLVYALAGGAAAILLVHSAECLAAPLQGREPQPVRDHFILEPPGVSVQNWVSGLDVPWSLVFLPDGRALISERRGQICLVDANGRLAPEPYATLHVAAHGEGGLMGLTLHPNFSETPYVYAMLTR